MKPKGAVFSRRLDKCRRWLEKDGGSIDRYIIMSVLGCSYPAAGVYLAALRAEDLEKNTGNEASPPGLEVKP